PENSHVLPAMIRRFHEAKINSVEEVAIWGSGTPKREFLFADDMAQACIYLMETYNEKGFLNIGTGEDISIIELAKLVARVVGYRGSILTDPKKPDGTPRKLMDVSKLHQLGWKHTTSLEEGVRSAYEDFLSRY